MELSERILEILEKSGLTPSEFADKIEVQRSAISHITSGRNKPSLEFLIKIKNVFPEIDTEWLFLGTQKEAEIHQPISNSTLSPTLFDLEELDEKKIKEENIIEINKNTTESISKDSKKIKKVVLFYEDGTFDDFSQNTI